MTLQPQRSPIATLACLIAATFASPDETIAGDAAETSGTDRYGGTLAIEAEATGFFRVEQIGRRWLFVTPDGHGYFALGANHVGRYLDEQADELGLLDRFGNDRGRAAAFLIGQMRAMGLNAGEAYAPLAPELKTELPYVANLRFPEGGKYRFDMFDPALQDRLTRSVIAQCAAFRDDPMAIGIAFADLPVWDGRRVAYFESLAEDRPGAIALAESRAAGRSDEAFLAHAADTLYAVLSDACERGAPNHLFFGERFRLRGTPDAVIAAVGPHVDVFCTQALILSPQRPPEWQVFQPERYAEEHDLAGKPLVVIDWAAPFSLGEAFETDRGTLHGERVASEQAAAWLAEAAAQPFLVGVFKCQFIGLHGNDRWFDGRARRTYLQDDGRPFDVRTALTRDAHRQTLRTAYGQTQRDRP